MLIRLKKIALINQLLLILPSRELRVNAQDMQIDTTA
jgi:hypothetical protein